VRVGLTIKTIVTKKYASDGRRLAKESTTCFRAYSFAKLVLSFTRPSSLGWGIPKELVAKKSYLEQNWMTVWRVGVL
jgi:hypothetical protein